MAELNKESILKEAIAIYGETLQKTVACEEMAELIKEVVKSIRGANNRKEILEEISDVSICIEQLKLMYKITDAELEDEIKFKLVRLNGRLRGEQDD